MNRRLSQWLWRALVLAVLLAAAVPFAVNQWRDLVGGARGSAARPVAENREAPCLPGRAVPLLTSPHIPESEADLAQYNSLPPTSGPHFAFSVAPGVYDSPLREGLTVHALEHGHVVIQYAADTPEATVRTLSSIARRHPADVVLAPYPKLGHGVALTAWGRIDLLDAFDDSSEDRVTRFVLALRGRYSHEWTRPDPC
ncbi:DUF3105 domain-containing protein [Kitasatospora sp. NPDC001664]|uniref:DUF3105 domain-containing protein n=1 Tax=Kitasatospora albolonga TaxID=68173 RepID=UPI0035EA4D0F